MLDDILLLSLSSEHPETLARYFSWSATSRATLILLMFAMIIGAIWTAIFLWDRWQRSAEAAELSGRSLFDELCAAHRLERQDVALLADAARACQLESPASLFARPDRFDLLCTEPQPNADAYRQLRDRLFGKSA